jgi:hypothetical protein
MKITKSKLKLVILEELQNILAEQDTGETKVVSRPGQKAALARRQNRIDQSTQEIDMDAVIQRQIDDMSEPGMFRAEAKRLFDEFFYDINEYGIERMTHDDPQLDEIVSKLAGWMMPRLYKGDDQPSPMFVKVAQEFEKEGIGIVNNEQHFLDRVEEKVIALAKRGFAQTGAGSDEDIAAVDKQNQEQAQVAAQSFAVGQVIKVLRKEDPERYGSLPDIKDSSAEIVAQLIRDIPRVKPRIYKQAYDYYMKQKG